MGTEQERDRRQIAVLLGCVAVGLIAYVLWRVWDHLPEPGLVCWVLAGLLSLIFGLRYIFSVTSVRGQLDDYLRREDYREQAEAEAQLVPKADPPPRPKRVHGHPLYSREYHDDV